MKIMLRTIALATAAMLIATGGLAGQVLQTSQPVPSTVDAGSSNAGSEAIPPTLPQVNVDLNRLRNLRTMTKWASSGGEDSVLVVPAAEMSMEDLVAVTQDMTVMARILRTAMGQGNTNPYSSGVYGERISKMFIGQSIETRQNIYLQGFGALFAMKVDFPLAPGAEEQEEAAPEEPQTDVDPVWTNTQRQLFDPDAAERDRSSEDNAPKYSAEQVEKLKTSVITSLKHAVNIRNLASGEVVVVTVTGEPIPDNIVSVQTVPGTTDVLVVQKGGNAKVYKGGLPKEISTSASTVLTFRAKVSDISAFAKGDVKLDQFRQKVQVISQPQLGGAAGRTVSTSFSTGF